MDLRISKNLVDAGFETRPAGNNGLWCSLLLPLVLLLNTVSYDVSPAYQVSAVLSMALLAYSLLFITFMNNSCATLKDTTFKGSTPLSCVAAMLINLLTGQSLLFCLLVSFFSVHCYSHLLRHVLKDFPKTFTVGEAMIVAQGIVLFIASAVSSKFLKNVQIDEEQSFLHSLILIVLFTVTLLIVVLYNLNDSARNIEGLALLVLGAASVGILLMVVFMGLSAIPQLFHYLLSSYNRIQILLLWLLLVLIAILVLIVQTRMKLKATTSTRKTFHVLASAVFLTGVLADVNLMTLAAGLGFALLILVEAIRKSKIKPISTALQSAFEIYSDEKDCGLFAMSPIYLLVGLSCPLAVFAGCRGAAGGLALLGGVRSVGVGDSAASWAGSLVGTTPLPGTKKTLEGMVCNALSQVLLVAVLEHFGWIDGSRVVYRAAAAGAVSAAAEAATLQQDNLVLPLITAAADTAATWLL